MECDIRQRLLWRRKLCRYLERRYNNLNSLSSPGTRWMTGGSDGTLRQHLLIIALLQKLLRESH